MQRIQAVALLSVGVAVAALLSIFAIPWQVSYSNNGIAQLAEQESSSDLTTIRVTGESSKRIEPDQVTITMSVQTPPADFQSVIGKHQETVKKVVEAVKSASGGDEKISIKFGQTSMSPYYTGAPSSDSATFAAYASVPITTDIDHFPEIAKKLSEAGFRIENLYVTAVLVNPSEPATTTNVQMQAGSANAGDNKGFDPKEVQVAAGTTVVWHNDDAAGHTVTSGKPGDPDAGSLFDSTKDQTGFLVNPGATWKHTFDTAGVYPYFCQVHPWMTGLVTVTEESEKTESKAENKEFRYQVSMNIAIETQPDTLQNVIKMYQEKFKTLTKVLEENEISTDKIQQSSVNFNPIYYGPGQYSFYNAYTQIIVKTDIQSVDNVATTARTAGTNIESIFLSISDSAIDNARKELNQQALENAKSRAMEIVEPMGLEIKGVKRIEVNTNPLANPYGVTTYKGVNLGPYYDPGLQSSGEVSISITVEFEIGK